MKILDHSVPCTQPGRYIGWPTIARTPEDELLVVFSGDRDQHVCPFGKVFLIRSTDHGRTWSEPRAIVNTPLDDRDAGLLACRDGTLVVSWFNTHYPRDSYFAMCRGEANTEKWARWEHQIAAVTPEVLTRWTNVPLDKGFRGHWFIRSTDRGRTWSEPTHVLPNTPHGPIETADGTLLFLGNNGYERAGQTSSFVVAGSTDKGATWSIRGTIPMFVAVPGFEGRTPYLAEPHLVEARPDRLVALARSELFKRQDAPPYPPNLWQFDSDDGGHTWSAPRSTALRGKPPHLLKLADGRLLATYGVRFPPFGIRACLSSDAGATWQADHEIVLRDDAPNGDLGYPATVACADGSLLTVYYICPKPGEMTVLAATRWTL